MEGDLDTIGEEEKQIYESELKILEENETKLRQPSFQIRPTLADIFKGNKIKLIIQNVMSKVLQGQIYSLENAKKLSKEIADTVNLAVKDLNMKRYKHVVQVTLGQHLGAGCNYIARCRWDAECDSYTSDVFSNASLFCICTVFGIYVY